MKTRTLPRPRAAHRTTRPPVDPKATTKAQILEAVGLIESLAEQFVKYGLPRGFNIEDLVSAGNEGIAEAARDWSPTRGVSWPDFVRDRARRQMQSALSAAKRETRRSRPLDFEMENGDRLPRADRNSAEPHQVLSARETTEEIYAAAAKRPVLDPAAVAEKVTALRSAMFADVEAADVKAVMAKIVAMAKDGNWKAIDTFLQLLGNGPPGMNIKTDVNVAFISERDVS